MVAVREPCSVDDGLKLSRCDAKVLTFRASPTCSHCAAMMPPDTSVRRDCGWDFGPGPGYLPLHNQDSMMTAKPARVSKRAAGALT